MIERPAGRNDGVTLDVVIPVYNEEDVLPRLAGILAAVFSPELRERWGIRGVRYVIVDDGSTDRSAQIVRDLIAGGLPAILYRLSRNFGHQSAVSAGLAAAQADVVAVIDADLQDPPELIFEMLERWRAGDDVVYARRRRRQEALVKRVSYWLFYRVLAFLAETRIPLDSGDFCLMDRRAVAAINALPERLRFPRVLRAWVGFQQGAVAYDRPARRAGRTKYTLARLYRLATDGIAAASVRPLQVAQFLSFIFFGGSLVFGLLLLLSLLTRSSGIPSSVLLLAVLVTFGNALLMLYLYILGAYVARIYLEVKGRPPYVVMEVVGEVRDGQ